NYSDGLSDAPLPEMIEAFKASGKLACFLAVRPPFTFHLVEFGEGGNVERLRANTEADIWINAGYFIFRKGFFDYMKDGEELVLDPFNRLIADGKLMAYRYNGFWRAMDTLKDRQDLEAMVEKGDMPWRVNSDGSRKR